MRKDGWGEEHGSERYAADKYKEGRKGRGASEVSMKYYVSELRKQGGCSRGPAGCCFLWRSGDVPGRDTTRDWGIMG